MVLVCFKIFTHMCISVPKRLDRGVDPLGGAGVMVCCELPFESHRS